MKKLTTIIAGFILVFSASAFIPASSVSTTITSYFQKDFANVTNVKWEKIEDTYVASFLQKGEPVSAAYNEDGQLLGVARNVSISELPEKASQNLQKKYGTFAIQQSVVELTSDIKNYLITVQDNKCILTLMTDPNGSLTVIKKVKK